MAKERAKKLESLNKERANFSLTNVSEKTNFHQFEDFPETSVLLYHLNSGHEKFRAIDDLLKLSDNEAKDIKSNPSFVALQAEIKDKILTIDEHEDLVQKFLKKQGKFVAWDQSKPKVVLDGLPPSVDSHHLICGMCGITKVQGRYGCHCHVVKLKDLPSSVLLSESELEEFKDDKNRPPLILPINENGDTQEFHVYKLQSAFESTHLSKTFHLHPEAVHEIADSTTGSIDKATVVCHKCNNWIVKSSKSNTELLPPANSIAAGVDFGVASRLGLQQPSLAEMKVIARHRHFHNVVKVHSNHLVGSRSDCTKCELRGSSSIFCHDAHVVTTLELMITQLQAANATGLSDILKNSLTIELVGPEGEMEKIYRNARNQTHLRCRAYVLYQWLAVLQQSHSSYKSDPQLLLGNDLNFQNTFKSFQSAVNKANEEVALRALHVSDTSSINADKVEGDDVAQVRSQILNKKMYKKSSNLILIQLLMQEI